MGCETHLSAQFKRRRLPADGQYIQGNRLRANTPHRAQRGFRKILTGPAHPDYLPFCQGPGHGTGYQDQIIIEARDFLRAIETGEPVWPTLQDGLEVSRVVAAALQSASERRWIELEDL